MWRRIGQDDPPLACAAPAAPKPPRAAELAAAEPALLVPLEPQEPLCVPLDPQYPPWLPLVPLDGQTISRPVSGS